MRPTWGMTCPSCLVPGLMDQSQAVYTLGIGQVERRRLSPMETMWVRRTVGGGFLAENWGSHFHFFIEKCEEWLQSRGNLYKPLDGEQFGRTTVKDSLGSPREVEHMHCVWAGSPIARVCAWEWLSHMHSDLHSYMAQSTCYLDGEMVRIYQAG